MSAEFTSRLPLSRHRLDRDYLSRAQPRLFDELFADESTLVLVISDGDALVGADGHSLELLPPSGVPDGGLLLFLGRSIDDPSVAFVASVVDADARERLDGERPDQETRWGNLRELGTTLTDRDAGLFTEALALANWHLSHQFSPRTGSPTISALGGWVRRTEGEDTDLFPRTDAAIIVGITDADNRILLGSNAMWKANRYSLLAGFVEPGESLENAVVREVFEESGIRVTNPVYLGSQPWPFPASLMLGFRATVDPEQESTLEPDGEEILDLRWFSRDELTEALPTIALPGGTSIARAILEDWYGGPIADSREW